MNEPILVTTIRTTWDEKGKPVTLVYGYMARKATIFDEQLIAWANARDAELARRRA